MTQPAPFPSSPQIHGPGTPKRVRPAGFLVRIGDPIFLVLTLACAASIIVLTGWLAYQLFDNSRLAHHAFGWKFLISQNWDPVNGDYGALPFIYGTAVTSILALLFAIPLGLGTAVFLSELAPPKISSILAFLIDLLAAVPSVIYGLLGFLFLKPILSDYIVPPLQKTLGFLPIFSGHFYGVSIFTAGVVLSLMIVPFIISISREVLLAVPREQREASLALGSTHWEMVWRVVIPSAKRGIYGSIFLALARALGETMAVTMVIGNDPTIQKSLLAPGYTIAAVIANEFTEATDDLYISALIELGLVLFGVTFIINGLARLLIRTTAGAHHE